MVDGLGQTDYKFVVVLNKKIENGVVLNAATHMAACLTSKASDTECENMMFVNYIDADGGKHPVSALSFVILRADNSNKIRRLRQIASEKGLLFVDFLESMTKDTYVEQMEKTNQLKEEQLEYWGLCLFGKKDEIDPITRKFSIWR